MAAKNGPPKVGHTMWIVAVDLAASGEWIEDACRTRSEAVEWARHVVLTGGRAYVYRVKLDKAIEVLVKP